MYKIYYHTIRNECFKVYVDRGVYKFRSGDRWIEYTDRLKNFVDTEIKTGRVIEITTKIHRVFFNKKVDYEFKN